MTDERNAAIVARHAAGESIKGIAASLGLSRSRVWQIVTRAARKAAVIPARLDDGTPVESAGLSVRAEAVLRNAGYATLGEVRAATDEEILRTPNCGPATLREVRAAVARMGQP